MEPDFKDGSIVIVKKNLFKLRKPEINDILLFKNPVSGELYMKRCLAADEDSVFVTGLNLPESTDSRHFGSIPDSAIKGWVWIKI